MFFAPLDDVGAKAVALAAAGSMLPVYINAMTYELLQEMYAGQTVKEKMAKWMSSIGHKDRPLGLAKENTWLAGKGINEEPHRKDAASAILCAYDANRQSQENTVRIMELDDVIVFEESQAVYARS